MIASIRLFVVLTIVVLLTILISPIQLLLLKFSRRTASKVAIWWHRFVLWMFGIKVHKFGTPANDQPLLLVANHVSWKDILVLGSTRPLSFIAKADMKSWPVLGQLAMLQRTIFVEREQRRKTAIQASEIADRLSEGDVIVLFAEGTTSDGNRILPFNSSLIGAAQRALSSSDQDSVAIQPVAIAYTHMHGVALGRYHRPDAAWPGDVSLGGHLFNIVKQGALDVELHFGEPIPFDLSSNRKIVTRLVENQVRQMLNISLRGTRQD